LDEIRFQHNLVRIYRSLLNRQNLLNKLVEVNIPSRGGFLFEQGGNALDNVIDAVHLLDHVVQVATDLVKIRRFMLEPVDAGVAECGDCSQWLPDFVRFSAGYEKFASFTAQIGVHGAATVSMARIVNQLGVPSGIELARWF